MEKGTIKICDVFVNGKCASFWCMLNGSHFARTDKKGNKYIDYRVNPYRVYQLENMPFLSPYITQTKRIQEAAQNPKYLLNLFSGGRVYQKNLTTEKANREKEAQKLLEDMLYEQGIGSKYTIYLFPFLS